MFQLKVFRICLFVAKHGNENSDSKLHDSELLVQTSAGWTVSKASKGNQPVPGDAAGKTMLPMKVLLQLNLEEEA